MSTTGANFPSDDEQNFRSARHGGISAIRVYACRCNGAAERRVFPFDAPGVFPAAEPCASLEVCAYVRAQVRRG